MAKGVKKIKYSGGNIFAKMSVPNKRLTIAPEQWINFDVAEWFPDTTSAERKKAITWIRQSTDRKNIFGEISSSTGYKFMISKKLCGSYHFYIEASLFGKRDFKNPVGLYVKGHCNPKIVSSKWCTRNDSKDVRKTYTFSYGHVIFLNLDTEGLNGEKVTVDIYRVVKGGRGLKDDQYIHTYSNVEVIDGEINMKIGNSFLWYAKIGKPSSIEEFYVTVKNSAGQQISDGKSTVHANFLRLKNTIVSKEVEKSTTNTPVKIGEIEKPEDKKISYSAVYFRPLDSWNGEFGFDWLREKDNGLALASDPAYDGIIEGGYLNGKSDLTRGATGTAYTKLKTQYPNLAVSNTGYAVPTYFVPYLTLFSKDFVDTLPATVAVKPKYEATLKVLVAIKADIDKLEFEYDSNLLTVDKKILKDKSKTNGLVKSADVSIKVTCNKDLSSDKEIKVYCYPTNGMPRLLAGKIIILKNNAAVRKEEKFVLVRVISNITSTTAGKATGNFTNVDEQNFRNYCYQSLIIPIMENSPNILDLSRNFDFKSGGKYINSANLLNEDESGMFAEVKRLFLEDKDSSGNLKNSKYSIGYFTAFAMEVATYDGTPGQIQDIGIGNLILFNKSRYDTTMAHETFHGLGLFHAHKDDSLPIKDSKRKYVYKKSTTTNVMSYNTGQRKSTWRWQWHIVNPKISEK